jgi:cytochrome c peroxidase
MFHRLSGVAAAALAVLVLATGCQRTQPPPPWEAENPVTPLPKPPLGVAFNLASLTDAHGRQVIVTPERVRLGRWLFYDRRLSGDGTVACASCHHPENAFSEPTPVAAGIRGQKGTRKAPTFINEAATIYPHFFWDGRAGSLEDQALGPIANPIEMGSSHESMVATLVKVQGYRPYFKEAFGSDDITKERVAQAIASYERTRMSGNSPFDRWRYAKQDDAMSQQAKDGYDLFTGKAKCSQCHLGNNFTDSNFHNLGVGWDPKTKTFSDEGRWVVTKGTRDEGFGESDRGRFKTPTLREVTKHAPYMHDGSIATLREVVELYNRGGNKNPYLDPKIDPLKLTPAEVDALVAFMHALEGEGYQDTAPKSFPQ